MELLTLNEQESLVVEPFFGFVADEMLVGVFVQDALPSYWFHTNFVKYSTLYRQLFRRQHDRKNSIRSSK